MRPSRPADAAMLALVGGVSLCCTFLANAAVGSLLPSHFWLAESCLVAALFAVMVYLAIRPAHPFLVCKPDTPFWRVWRLAIVWLMCWLLGSVLYAQVNGSWQAYATGAASLVGFILLGPLTEELLFRGAIYELAARAFPRIAIAPILCSTVLFSLYHLQIHDFNVTPFVITQMLFVLPLGLVLGYLRRFTGGIWVGLLLHMLTNLPHAFTLTLTL